MTFSLPTKNANLQKTKTQTSVKPDSANTYAKKNTKLTHARFQMRDAFRHLLDRILPFSRARGLKQGCQEAKPSSRVLSGRRRQPWKHKGGCITDQLQIDVHQRLREKTFWVLFRSRFKSEKEKPANIIHVKKDLNKNLIIFFSIS